MSGVTGPGGKPLASQGLLELLGTALAGRGTVSRQEVEQAFYTPLAGRVLDPIAEASQQASPRHLAATLAVEAARQERAARQLDRGAAAADILGARVLAGTRFNELLKAIAGPFAGIEPNLSGFRKDRRLYYPIAPGVEYMVDQVASKVPGQRGGQVEFIKLADTPMMDWDTPDPRFHAPSSVTVRHLGDVEELVRQHLQRNPESVIKLYQTPGGYRAWELGPRRSPAEQAVASELMKVDPAYVQIAQQGRNWQVAEVPVAQPGFSSRISGKPGRAGDFVAQPLLELRGSDALIDPVSRERVRRYHDEPIRRSFLGEGGVSPQAASLVRQQAPHASEALRLELRRRGLL